MTEHEYFALMAEYLAQLERAVQENGGKIHGVTILRSPSLDRGIEQYQHAQKVEWARQQVNAVFDAKETDHEEPA